MKMIVKAARKSRRSPPAMPSTTLITSRHRDRDLVGARLHVLGGARVTDRGRARWDSRRLCTVCGRSWRKSRTPPTSGTRNSERDQQDGDGRADHGHGTASRPRDMLRLRLHEAHRVLEHEPEEDPDEHDQECVADLLEEGEDADRGGDDGTVRIGSRSSVRRRSSLMPITPLLRAGIREIVGVGRLGLLVGGEAMEPANAACLALRALRPPSSRRAAAFCSAILTFASPPSGALDELSSRRSSRTRARRQTRAALHAVVMSC